LPGCLNILLKMTTSVHVGRETLWIGLMRRFTLANVRDGDSKGVVEVWFGFEHGSARRNSFK
jgi:hypothetical protein